jgi:hypothetical protein
MADYYSAISRAVAALETNTFDDRRAIYNRARAAQSYQLGKRPFNKKDFDGERLMLEDGPALLGATNNRRHYDVSWGGISERLRTSA